MTDLTDVADSLAGIARLLPGSAFQSLLSRLRRVLGEAELGCAIWRGRRRDMDESLSGLSAGTAHGRLCAAAGPR